MPGLKVLVLSDDLLIRAQVELCLASAPYALWQSNPVDNPYHSIYPPMHGPDACVLDVAAGDIERAVQVASAIHDRWAIPTLFLVWPEDSHLLHLSIDADSQLQTLKPFDDTRLINGIRDCVQKHRFHHEASQAHSWFASTLRCIGDGIIATDSQGCIMFMNPVAERMTGFGSDDAYGRELAEIVHVVPEQHAASSAADRDSVAPGLLNRRGDLLQRDGSRLPIDVRGSTMTDEFGHLTGVVLVLRDMTTRRELEHERERLIQELQDALANLRTLNGLLPICAKCKKIRDDSGYWNQIERYIAQHSDATFTHSICPDCEAQYYESLGPPLSKK